MQKRPFDPGFRWLTAFDWSILVLGSVSTIALASVVWWWGFVVAFVVGHFFLFCNVVRLSRSRELAWALVFVSLAVATVTIGVPGWLLTALASLVATAILVVIEMRKPSYHGLGWRRINPGLPAWWEAQGGTSVR